MPFNFLRRPSKSRNLQLAKLEDRILFDATLDAGVSPNQHDINQHPAPNDSATVYEQDVAAYNDENQSPTNQQNRAANSSVATIRQELVIVDTSVSHYQQLVDDLLNNSDQGRHISVVLLDANVDGVEQVTHILSQYSDLDAVHLISHGDDAAIRLGNTWLTDDNLNAYAGQIARWGDALNGSGDLLIYGCDLAGSAEGRALVDSIAALTNTDVAASDDDTGAAFRGGDWDLEYRHGTLESTVVFSQDLQARYNAVLAVGPSATFSGSTQNVMIGETFDFTVRFDNTGTDTGYGPFIDLIMPVNGIDGVNGSGTDGITFNGATYLGQALNFIELTFPNSGGGVGTVTHPFARDSAGNPLEITGRAGDKLIVLELPFGSYTPDQPPADILVSATTSNLADLSAPLVIQTRSGFRYGTDPLDNPTSDPSILSDSGTNVTNPSGGATSWTQQLTVTPTLMILELEYLGPEDEIATGPNHIQQYQIDVDIANGQTISNLDIIDSLPNNIVVTSIDSVLVNGVAVAYTSNLGSLTFPGNNLDLIITPNNPVTGTTSTEDVRVVFSFYVTELDASGNRVIPINGEDDTISNPDSRSFNNARAVGDWTPIDARDAGGVNNAIADPDSVNPEHILDDKAIAIQKSVAIINNVGSTGVNPGDTLEYTLNFQISDFYTFGDLFVDDIFQDGQRFDFTYGATFTITDLNGTVTGSFTVRNITSPDGGQTLVVDQTQINLADNGTEDGTTPDGSDGSTTLRFNLSKVLTDNGAADGILQGGYSNGAINGGAAVGTIRFRTIVQDQYSDTFLSGDRSVDQGDAITNNNLSITGTVRQNAEDGSITNVLHTETDHSSAAVTIETGTLVKDVYAINGNTTLPTGPSGRTSLTPGDVVTYRIRYTLPTSDFENLVLTDFLPLPIFDALDHNGDGVINAADNWTFNLAGSFNGTAPASGVIEFGSGDTFFNSNGPNSNIVPTISIGASNELILTFGNYDDPSSQPTTLELYFSITAKNEPTADGLFLTNIVRVSEGTTQNGETVHDEIIQIEVLQPDLNITKGIVSANSPGVTYDSTIGPAGITFGTAGTGGALFTGGVINSTTLGTQRINANVTGGIDAGDTVRFAITLENTGTSTRGAYDVRISDSLPPGFTLVAGSVRVVDGTGAAITFTGAESDLFGTGIQLNDPGATPNTGDGTNDGAIDGYDATDGRNVVIVFYDVIADASVQAAGLYTNTAFIENFAGQEGGANHAASRPNDAANVRIENVSVTKTIVGTSEAHTTTVSGIERVTVGEIVRYRLHVALPEGSLTGLQIFDLLPPGLTFIDDGTGTIMFVSDGVGITSSTLSGTGLNGTGNQSNVGSLNPTFQLPDAAISRTASGDNDTYDTGRDIYIKLGDINNNDRDTNIEFAIIEFNVLVDNNATANQNDTGDSLFNDVRVFTNGVQIYDMPEAQRPQVIVVEPLIQNINKAGSITSGDAGDNVTYTVTFDVASGNNRSDAFDVRLLDTLPSGLTLGAITSVHIDGVATAFTNNTAGNTIDILLARVNQGQTVEVVYTATIDLAVNPEQLLANTANVTWSSLPGNFGTNNGFGGNNTGSDLATLNGINTGGIVYNTTTGALHGERNGSNGSGQPNDYATSDTHNITIDGITSFTKTLVSTEIDNASNGLNDVVIGELVTYRLRVSFPEGTTPNATILDTLDNGLAFVGMTNSSLNDVTISGSTTPVVSNNGRTVTFNFGTVTDANLTNNTDGWIEIEYQAVVLNTSGNQAGTTLDNTADFRWGNNPATSLVRDAADVIVREAHVEVTKTVEVNPPSGTTTGDAGDPVRYIITIENTGSYDAFDVTFSDALPTVSGGTSAILGATFSVVDSMIGGLNASNFTLAGNDSIGYTLTLNAGVDLDLLKSQGARTITLTIDGIIAPTNGPNAVIANNANAEWTSLDGVVGNRSTFASDDSGERDGTNPSDNRYDYRDVGSVSFSINPPTFTKSLFGTDQTETSGSDVTIGERVTYALRVQIPEGTTAGLSIVDLLPPGLRYENFQVITTSAGSNGLLSANFNGTISGGGPTVSGGLTDGDDVTFTFGQIDVSVDNDVNNNAFIILVTAVVSDVPTNVGYSPGQTILANTATIDVIGDGVGPVTSNRVDVNLVESNLVITKDIDKSLADAGELLTITLRIDNNGLGNAYDVRLTDVLSSANYDLSTLNLGTAGVDYPADFVAALNPGSGLLEYSGGTIAAGGFVEFTFTIDLADTVLPNEVLVNNATITNASTLSGTVAGERDNPDPDNDNSDTDDDSVTIRSNSLAGNVYFDANNDGVFGAGESGIGGVDVRLQGVDHLGSAVDITIQTQPDGSYLFDDLRPGTYSITQTQPTLAVNGKDYLDGLDTIGTPGGSMTNDAFSGIVLPTGTETAGVNNNFGELEEAELSGFVWHDADNDGVKDASEVGIGGVDVTLNGTNDFGVIVPITVTTNPDGSFSFDRLRPGEYTITQTQPTFVAPSGRNYADGRDVDGSLANGVSNNDVTSSINAAAGASGINYNFGEVVESIVSGYVYHDSNNDGSRNSETGIEFVTVTLTGVDDLGNTINLSTQTDANGYYEFANLRPSNASGYTLTQTTPAGYLDGIDTLGTPGGNASVNDVFSSINVASDTNGIENNFGEVLPASIRGTVFNDHNNDGVQTGTEEGINGVQIVLSGVDDLGNNVNLTVATNPDGSYSFTNLRPSNPSGYRLTESQPTNYNDGIDNDGSLANGDVSTNDVISSINVASGNNGTGYNFAELPVGISGTVYVDDNRDGVLSGGEATRVPGVLIELYDSTNTTLIDSMVTGNDGNYFFGNLPAGDYVIRQTQPGQFSSSTPNTINATLPLSGLSNQNFGETLWDLGDYLWFDVDGDGNQDSGEPGIGGVDISLIYAGLDGDFSTSGDNITYNTTTAADGSYRFNELFNGNYRTVIGNGLPAGMVGTAETDDSTPAIDGTSYVVINGADRFDIDFGFTGTGAIGDMVYWDQNADGMLDPDEIGIAGVNVELDIDYDADGTVDLTLNTVTDVNGNYRFDRVPAGRHTIRTTQPAGTAPTVDADGLGSLNRSTLVLGAGETNLNQDFGYRGTGSIGDTVFFDFGGDGGTFNSAGGDYGISGVTVTLEIDVDGDGNVDLTRTQVTDSNGSYDFQNLMAGDYRITLSAATLPAALGNHATVDPDATLDHITNVNLASGEIHVTADFGYFAQPEYTILKTNDLSGDAMPGQTFKYFITVNNSGDMNGTGVVVTDTLPINVLDTFSVMTNDAANVSYNVATGQMIWNVGDLNGLGGTRVLEVTVTVLDPVTVLHTTFDNTAIVADDGRHGPEVNPNNNDSTSTIGLTAAPDYEIQKVSSLTKPAMVGDSFEYTITVRNIGNQDGTGVIVTDQMPVTIVHRHNISTSDPSNVSYDPTTGQMIWNVGDLAGRTGTATLTVRVEIPFVVEDILARFIVNTANVTDDGANGLDPDLSNNEAVRTDEVVIFAFDAFNNFAVPPNPNTNPIWGWERGENARMIRPIPVDPIFSGLAEPGTTLSLRIYDDRGNIIGERQVVADSGGNWLANFPNVVIWKHPHRMDVTQTAPIQNAVNEVDGFNLRRYYHPASHHSLYFSEQDTVHSVMKNSAYATIETMHEANNNPLQVGWRSHLYQLNVSSTNAASK